MFTRYAAYYLPNSQHSATGFHSWEQAFKYVQSKYCPDCKVKSKKQVAQQGEMLMESGVRFNACDAEWSVEKMPLIENIKTLIWEISNK